VHPGPTHQHPDPRCGLCVWQVMFVAVCVGGVVLFLSLGAPVLKIMGTSFPTVAPDQM
jgi:hypothetical protein